MQLTSGFDKNQLPRGDFPSTVMWNDLSRSGGSSVLSGTGSAVVFHSDVLHVIPSSVRRFCSSGDENIPHVPQREHQRGEQAEGRREAGGEAVQQVWGPQRQPAAARRPPAKARLRQENRKDEREGGRHRLRSALFSVRPRASPWRRIFMNIGSLEQSRLQTDVLRWFCGVSGADSSVILAEPCTPRGRLSAVSAPANI